MLKGILGETGNKENFQHVIISQETDFSGDAVDPVEAMSLPTPDEEIIDPNCFVGGTLAQMTELATKNPEEMTVKERKWICRWFR